LDITPLYKRKSIQNSSSPRSSSELSKSSYLKRQSNQKHAKVTAH